MKTALFAVAVAALSFSGAAFADDVTGAWKVTGDVVGNALETVCTFAGTADKTTASCVNKEGQAAAATPAKVTGKDVTWDWDAGQATLTFKGTMDNPKTMKGDIEVQGVTGSFTAAKQ
ncbi:MAG: hypothetical protein JWM91_4692 [Rhodospirillales bacterium]|nr:hypothetical protein [Rhodospirillales bacterium]